MSVKPIKSHEHNETADYIEKLFLPEPPFDLIVNNFYCFTSFSSSKTFVKHLSPNLETMLVFNFGEPIRYSFGSEKFTNLKVERYAVIAPLKKMLNYEAIPGTDFITVNFRLNGFHRLFNTPISNLSQQTVIEPDTLLKKKVFSKLWKSLFVLKDPAERVNEMILSAIPFIKPNSDQIRTFLKGERFFYDPLLNPTKAIASETNLTERMIQMKFQEQVGYSPKELTRFLRFKKVVLKLLEQETDKLDVFKIIAEQGYYDQSHFIKDFKHFLGTTPKIFFKSVKDKDVCIIRDGDPQTLY